MRASQARQLESLESLYREMLIAALENCAAGRSRVFGHGGLASGDFDAARLQRLFDPDGTVQELLDLGSKIDRLRERYGYEPFALHARLLQMRSTWDSNTPGEPTLARQWLDELRDQRA